MGWFHDHIAEPFSQGMDKHIDKHGGEYRGPKGKALRTWRASHAPMGGTRLHPGIFDPELYRDWDRRLTEANKDYKKDMQPIIKERLSNRHQTEQENARFNCTIDGVAKQDIAKSRDGAIAEIREDIENRYKTLLRVTTYSPGAPRKTQWQEDRLKEAERDRAKARSVLDHHGNTRWYWRVLRQEGKGELGRRTKLKQDFYRAQLEVTLACNKTGELDIQHKREVLKTELKAHIIGQGTFGIEDGQFQRQLERLQKLNKALNTQAEHQTEVNIAGARHVVLAEMRQEIQNDYNVTVNFIQTCREKIDGMTDSKMRKEKEKRFKSVVTDRISDLGNLRWGMGEVDARTKASVKIKKNTLKAKREKLNAYQLTHNNHTEANAETVAHARNTALNDIREKNRKALWNTTIDLGRAGAWALDGVLIFGHIIVADGRGVVEIGSHAKSEVSEAVRKKIRAHTSRSPTP